MSGLSFDTIMKVAELAAAVETGGASAALETAAEQAVSQMATQAFSSGLSQTNLPASTQSAATSAFSSAFNGATGSAGGSSQTSQSVFDAAYRNGGLAQSTQQVSSSIASLINALGATGQQSSSGSGGSSGATGDNWMEAIAKAMGDALGKLSQQVVDESQQLDSLAGSSSGSSSSGSGAEEFQSTMAKFQADSQTLGMLSDAFANAIKSIGQGMQTMASKQ
jgi:uncharacterized protein YukE